MEQQQQAVMRTTTTTSSSSRRRPEAAGDASSNSLSGRHALSVAQREITRGDAKDHKRAFLRTGKENMPTFYFY